MDGARQCFELANTKAWTRIPGLLAMAWGPYTQIGRVTLPTCVYAIGGIRDQTASFVRFFVGWLCASPPSPPRLPDTLAVSCEAVLKHYGGMNAQLCVAKLPLYWSSADYTRDYNGYRGRCGDCRSGAGVQ